MGRNLTTAQAAARLGAHVVTVRNWLEAGDLAGVKVGRRWRVSEEALARFEMARTGRKDHQDASGCSYFAVEVRPLDDLGAAPRKTLLRLDAFGLAQLAELGHAVPGRPATPWEIAEWWHGRGMRYDPATGTVEPLRYRPVRVPAPTPVGWRLTWEEEGARHASH